ncbi:MAG: peptide ABC transporter substrate-binding protein [Ruminococcaceae bacterium]|nr:peptide ABC transporter substrate-binding protein [Oscillospiraceae bacterium]
MKKFAKRSICILLSVIFVTGIFSACSGKKFIDFIYPFSANVNSYDPQVASTSDEFLIIENTFEGLIRKDDDGTVRKGVADSWDISSDGLTYTFHLKKGIKWNINTDKYEEGEHKGEFKDERLEMLGKEFNPDITANDFVFALQRAASPETQCPLFSTIASIKNASAVYSGKADKSKLGVKALDDYTLEIKLAYRDDAMMDTLTSAVAMPCNEEFFNATKGRYGLKTKYTLFNGQFYLSQVLETSYLLKKNDNYKGDFPASASELTLKIADKDDDTVSKLTSGYYDAAFLKGTEIGDLLENDGLTSQPYIDTTWAMQFNTTSSVFSSRTLRRAFCLGFERLNEPEEIYLSDAKTLTPSSCKIGANNAVDATGTTVYRQNNKKSISLWKAGLKALDVTDVTVNVITVPEMENAMKQTLQGIQSGIATVVRNDDGDKIDFVIKVQTMTEAEMKTAMVKGNYDIAMVPLRATSDSAISFLRYVVTTARGIDKKKVESTLSKAEKASDLKSKSEQIKAAEKQIINSYALYPMIYETGYYVQATGVSGVQFHSGTGRISFVNATRK